MKGKLITLEGIDGSGKTYQSNKIREYLVSKGIDVILVQLPMDRSILDRDICDRSRYHLFMIDMYDCIDKFIIPALSNGVWVVCDRYIDSTIAYQQYGLGIKVDKGGIIEPDITLYFDIDLLVQEKRLGSRDKIESKGEAFYRKVIRGYEEILKQDRCKWVDGSKDKDSVTKAVIAYLRSLDV